MMVKSDRTPARVFAIIVALIVMATAVSLAGCSSGGADEATPGSDTNEVAQNSDTEEATQDTEEENVENDKPVIEITMQGGGKIEVELDPSVAPLTVENFLKLANEGFYNGLTFHRIIPKFMIQGGDPEGTGMGGSSETIKGEFSSNGWDNPISHKRGVISMARSQSPDSASSQFFITNADSEFLDGEYAAFGHVTSGMEEVDRITAVKTGAGDAPISPVVIESIKQIK
jgi:peptidyl-prolyl cis-trans isomerase B (cyclophilin B)